MPRTLDLTSMDVDIPVSAPSSIVIIFAMNLEDLGDTQPASTAHCRSLSPVGIFSRPQKPAPAIVAVKESLEFVKSFCKAYEAKCY